MEKCEQLLDQMNLFYHDWTQEQDPPKPSSFKEGQLCVVFWTEMKRWCRAAVQFLISDSLAPRVACFLVDHGEQLIISPDRIRVLLDRFTEPPFRVKKFQLAGIKPTTLRVTVLEEEEARLVPSARWDSSATLYLLNLLKVSTQTEAVFVETEADCTSIQLYLTINQEKVCVNDDLVLKKFAFRTGSADCGGSPFMLCFSTLTQRASAASNWLPKRVPAPPGRHGATSSSVPSDTSDLVLCDCRIRSVEGEISTPVSMDVRKRGIVVHSALAVEPCSSLDDAPVTDTLRWILQKEQYILSPTDCCSWPAVTRGINTLIISHNANRPISYLYPQLTHILLGSMYTTCSVRPGPIAVLLCPGWRKVQAVYELLQQSRVGPVLRPMAVLLGLAKEEANAVKIPRNCLLVVTTPFSLVRLLSCHCFLFMRIAHLVLDEADRLFSVAPDQMSCILQHFQKVISSKATPSGSQQLVAVAKTWTSPMRDLLARHMPQPCIVIGVPEEAVLYGNVQQVSLLTQDSCKLSILLALLELNPEAGQKTLVVCGSQQEVDDVFKALRSRSLFCLKTHEDGPHELPQWRADMGPGTHLILVTTDQCLKHLDISDAMSVLHYSFPSSPGLFGRRILCMAQHFPNLAQAQVESRAGATRSVLLVTEKSARHVTGLVRFLVRSGAPVPPELLALARDAQAAREDEKERRPLCSYLKSLGVCRDSRVCPDRHRLAPGLDQPQLPAPGFIEVLPLYVKTASVFLGRIVGASEEDFQRLSSEMACYYADRKPGASELLEGGLYAVQEDKLFHRVKVLRLSPPADRLFFTVPVRFLDVGKEVEVRSHQLLQLPERFHSLPAQAVEMVVCGVRPIDGETDWCPKVTIQISQKIRGLQHQARAVLRLGNTLFVDHMIRVSRLPGLKACINEYSVRSEILKSSMAENNPDHLDRLRALLEAEPSSQKWNSSRFRTSDWLTVNISPRKEEVPADAAQIRTVHVSSSAETNCDDSDRRFHPLIHWYQTPDSVIIRVKLINPTEQSCCFHADRVVYSGSVASRSYRADLQLQQLVQAERCSWEMKSGEPVLRLVKQQQESWDRLVSSKNIFVSYDLEHVEEDEDGGRDDSSFPEKKAGSYWNVSLDDFSCSSTDGDSD
ncbi:putative ATP-dependent RNA helicase TDRD12 [Salarias fasciatus]|uniref:putative ATP-dependent RNA helicase TDRD12 n=1 Tax=Salarias fasciatus TaxID=181472 RepID=UPI001176C3BE|nr:putative ATP-dependent RNA helicase TDRD12 [Salarias fasciatus]